MQQEQKNHFPIVQKVEVTIDVAEDQLINSLLAATIGREPADEDYFRVGLSYSFLNPKLRLISVDGKCLGALVYEKETLIGDRGMEERMIVRFTPEIKKIEL